MQISLPSLLCFTALCLASTHLARRHLQVDNNISAADSEAAAGAGLSSCPCLDATAVTEGLADFITAEGLLACEACDNSTYPTTYGADGCKAHEMTLPPSCGDESGAPLADAPEWCGEMWCYVDPEDCDGVDDASESNYFPDSGVHYSYRTCGGDETYWEQEQLEQP
mmetsp:Transcript_10515/g.25492  ORF Transcript_10515/g.25492 Transcript_10515/m.25492 type:complete len:167 (+) Transcript_10515:30-530(+)